MRRGAILQALFALFMTTGCSGVRIRQSVSPGPPIPARFVAIYPFGLRWKAPAYRAYELAMDEVAVVLAGGTLGAIGPTEFQVRNTESDALFAATSLAGSLAAWGLRPENVLALRGWAERLEAADVEVLYDTAGKPIGQRRNADVKLVIHEELLGPGPGGLVAEVSAVVPIDPFADHPSYDPDPELRRWVGKLTAAVLAAAADRLHTVAQVTDPGFDLTLDPRDEETFELPGRPALATLLAAAEPVDKEAARLDRLMYFDPDLGPKEVELFERLPHGLYVTGVRSEDAVKAGMKAGDLIVGVQGEPAAGEQTLRRWLSRTEPGLPVSLTVLRAAERVAIHLPAPPR
jgi:hypothetical protein